MPALPASHRGDRLRRRRKTEATRLSTSSRETAEGTRRRELPRLACSLIDGKPDEAAAQAKEAVKRRPVSAGCPIHARARPRLRETTPHAAETAFEDVLKLNPRAAAARLQLARLQLAQRRSRRRAAIGEEVSRDARRRRCGRADVPKPSRQGDLPRAERWPAGIARDRRSRGPAPPRARLGRAAAPRRRRGRGSRSGSAAPGALFVRRACRACHRSTWSQNASSTRPAADRRMAAASRPRSAAARSCRPGRRWPPGKTEAEQALRALVAARSLAARRLRPPRPIAMSNGQLDRALPTTSVGALARRRRRRSADDGRHDSGSSRRSGRRSSRTTSASSRSIHAPASRRTISPGSTRRRHASTRR